MSEANRQKLLPAPEVAHTRELRENHGLHISVLLPQNTDNLFSICFHLLLAYAFQITWTLCTLTTYPNTYAEM
jgi:hypothetical protein